LEPLYKKGNTNAVFLFNQWLLFKVYQGLFHTLKEVEKTPPSTLKFNEQFVERVINQLELARTDKLSDEEDYDFFRQIKSRIISPKAAIYPGVTNYSASFHVGHDAEEIDVWIKPDSSDYLHFMFQVLERRLPSEVYKALLDANEPLLQLVCYAAFGIPRALLNMTRNFYKPTSSTGKLVFEINFNRAKALRAIKSSFDNTFSVYSSLRVNATFVKRATTRDCPYKP